jgi:hypothetical protein
VYPMSKRRTVQLDELGGEVRVSGTTLDEIADLEYLPGEQPVGVVDADMYHPLVLRFLASHVVEPEVTTHRLHGLSVDALTRLFAAVLNVRPETRRMLRVAARGGG